jgi:hypothetical protein
MQALCADVCAPASPDVKELLAFTSSSTHEKTKFATAVLSLLEATEQLAELERNSKLGVTEGREQQPLIPVDTLRLAKESLFGQQLRAIELLQDLSARGGSLAREPEHERLQPVDLLHIRRPSVNLAKVDVHELSTSCGETSCSDGEDWCKAAGSVITFRGPPGLSAPPGLCAPPPGLSAPPGLEQSAACGSMKKSSPWRSRTVDQMRTAKKVAPWRSSKHASTHLSKAEPVDTKAVMAVNRRMSALLDNIDYD